MHYLLVTQEAEGRGGQKYTWDVNSDGQLLPPSRLVPSHPLDLNSRHTVCGRLTSRRSSPAP